MSIHVDIGSVWRGLCVVNRGEIFRRWCLWPIDRGGAKFWCHAWTPIWHEGRGPYVTIGLYWFAIMCGYYGRMT
jgi:hypothetical protein